MSRVRVETDVTVIGAGVVGLAIASRLSEKYSTIVVEKNSQFGQETSSRNSEVIHSGIYYPSTARKTVLCLQGRELLYAFCSEFSIPHQRCGKFMVATAGDEEAYLEELRAHCQAIGVPCEEKHPGFGIRATRALFFPLTGIIDSHAFMQWLERRVRQQGEIVYNHCVQRVERDGLGWVVQVKTPDGVIAIKSQFVINAAGLAACELSKCALRTDRYLHKFCRGRYFQLSQKYCGKFPSLIYPVPVRDGLGVHITIDLAGHARLGPDVEWSEAQTYLETASLYDADWQCLKPKFMDAVHRYCPSIQSEDLSPGLVGIRPKLFVDGTAFPDFLIENLGGFVHCLGIESPGLTASLAIAENVRELL